MKPREAERQERERKAAAELDAAKAVEPPPQTVYVSGMPAAAEQPQKVSPTLVAIQVEDERYALERRIQAFFATMANGIRAPHCGADYRSYVREMLLRAEEARLYNPREVP